MYFTRIVILVQSCQRWWNMEYEYVHCTVCIYFAPFASFPIVAWTIFACSSTSMLIFRISTGSSKTSVVYGSKDVCSIPSKNVIQFRVQLIRPSVPARKYTYRIGNIVRSTATYNTCYVLKLSYFTGRYV